MKASSIHHQMMIPFLTDCKILAIAHPPRSSNYLGENDESLNLIMEPEVVWFYATNCLAIQPHPEFMHKDDPFVDYCKTLVAELLLKPQHTLN
jgi:hypothetical protein